MGTRTIHPFPARMAPEIALAAIPESDGYELLTVVDPMCGSGTVLSAAVSRRQRAIGIDIDPLAVLMSRVATAPIDTELLTTTAAATCRTATAVVGSPPWRDDETAAFVDFWFGWRQKRQLIALSSAIASIHDDVVRDALQVALSRIIVTKSPQASLAADTAHSRPHRVIKESEYDVLDGFVRSTRSLKRLLDARLSTGSAKVLRGDSRMLDGVPDDTADLVVTSPPYLNALDYMRGHKLALVWFGYSIAELRRLRGNSIGAERPPDSAASERVNQIVAQVQDGASSPETLRIGMLQRYAEDMVGFAGATSRIIKPGGIAVLVVGNSTLRGNYIKNDEIARAAMSDRGFDLVSRIEREIPATRRYMPINTTEKKSSTLSKRMRSEIILTMAAVA